MTARILQYSDIENAYDTPERIGRLAGTIDALRDDRTVVVGTGDNTGPGVLADECDGRQALDFFRAVSPDVETPGNHDFDFGPAAAREMAADAPQQWICANVYESDGDGDGEDGGDENARFGDLPPWTVVERDGLTVGFVGVTDPALPDIAPSASDLTTTDPVDAVADALPALRERADRVVVLAHLRAEDEHDIAEFDGVDAILGGHNHTERRERRSGTLLLRPGANGAVVWAVELGEEASATRHEVADGPIAESVAASLRERLAEAGLSETVGTVAEPIRRTRERRYSGENRASNLVADAYRWATDADVGFVLTGSIREGPPLAGEVTVADVRGVCPFAGELCVSAVTGRELRDLVSGVCSPDGAASDKTWCGHVSGMTVRYDPDAEAIRGLTVDGEPLALDGEYTVASNRYVNESGSSLTPLTPDHVVRTWGVQYDAVVEYARETGLDIGLDGRIQRV